MRSYYKFLCRGLFVFSFLVICFSLLAGAERELEVVAKLSAGKIRGFMFGDYFWVASSQDESIEDFNGFWFRRIYFTYDYSSSNNFDVRFRLDMKSPGDFVTTRNIIPFIQDAFIRYNLKKNLNIMFGISPNPRILEIYKVWGYRRLEKTVVDLQRIVPTRDFSIAVIWRMNIGMPVKYHLVLGNGSQTGSETNKGKKIALSINMFPGNIVAVLYGDYEQRIGSQVIYTVDGFVAYKKETFRIGVEAAFQGRRDGQNFELPVSSVFFILKMSEELNLITRYDRVYKPNPLADIIDYIPFSTIANSNLIILAVDYQPYKDMSITPNIELVLYDNAKGGVEVTPDIIPRVTIFYRY